MYSGKERLIYILLLLFFFFGFNISFPSFFFCWRQSFSAHLGSVVFSLIA